MTKPQQDIHQARSRSSSVQTLRNCAPLIGSLLNSPHGKLGTQKTWRLFAHMESQTHLIYNLNATQDSGFNRLHVSD